MAPSPYTVSVGNAKSCPFRRRDAASVTPASVGGRSLARGTEEVGSWRERGSGAADVGVPSTIEEGEDVCDVGKVCSGEVLVLGEWVRVTSPRRGADAPVGGFSGRIV